MRRSTPRSFGSLMTVSIRNARPFGWPEGPSPEVGDPRVMALAGALAVSSNLIGGEPSAR